MKKIFFVSISVFVLMALYFFQERKCVVQSTDYEQFISGEYFKKNKKGINSQIDFWENKLIENPQNFVFEKKLASVLSADFKSTGNVESLSKSDSILSLVNKRIPNQVGVLHTLASNAIARHAFREAEIFLKEAENIGEEKFATSLMLADVHMERGDLFSANYLLKDIASVSHFDYLIREMKMHDEKGDLESAINSMEKAAALAKASGRKELINWSLSNLGDMYGHDGRIQKSYESYLEALSFNPADLHSLKGIAWVAFSHDQNFSEAKRILNHLKSIHPMPDYDLMLADIYEMEGDFINSKRHKNIFEKKAANPAYGNMYRTYLGELKSETTEAISIAEAEVEERPHTMSYDLLAWSYFQNGKLEKASAILKRKVINQTSEPAALYHAGLIFKAIGEKSEAKKYLSEALDAKFELGPLIAMEIERELAEL